MNVRPSLFIGFAAGVGIGAGGAYVYFQRTKGFRTEDSLSKPAVVTVNTEDGTGHPALKHGAPMAGDMIRVFDSYVAAFDSRK